MMNTELVNRIEALLFYLAESVSVSRLATLCDAGVDDVEKALSELGELLKDRGIRLQRGGEEVQLVTAPEHSEVLEKLRAEELERELGKAALETLAIIAYKGEVPRAEIDHIRGVNSTYSIRSLLMRGLIEKKPNPNDQRSFLYSPSLELLSYLGITDRTALPDFEVFVSEMETFADAQDV